MTTAERGCERRLLEDLRALCGPVPAVIASSALFAIAHVDPSAMVFPFVGGIVSSIFALRTGSLVPSIGLHVGWNAIAEKAAADALRAAPV